MDIPSQWPKYTAESGRKFLDIGRQIEAKDNLRMDRISLWNDIISRMLEVESTAFCSISSHLRNQPIDLLSADTSLTPVTSPVVTTKYGAIRGLTKRTHAKVGGGLVDIYTNIPYAKPPLGELRFQPPEDPERWGGVRDGTVSPPACLQPSASELSLLPESADFSEDCLYLRIHSPHVRNTTTGLPVLVFIDGKGFKHADGVHLDLSNMAAFGNMVVITLNYRLGALGFLSTGLGTDITGNYGLYDILSALRWIKESVGAFGGDPERVSVGGQESGAILAHTLLFIPQAEGLFSQLLSLGGSALQPSAVGYMDDRLESVKAFVDQIGCPTLPYVSMLTCMYSAPADKFLLSNASDLPNFTFGPVIDQNLIMEDVNKMANEGTFQNVNVMFGYDEDYMTGLLMKNFPDGLMEDAELKAFMQSMVVHHLPIYRGADVIAKMIANHYFRETYTSHEVNNFQTYRGVVTDFLLAVPLEMSAKLHSRSGASAFLYKRPFQNEDPDVEQTGPFWTNYIPVFLGLAFNNHHYNYTFNDRDHYLSVQLMTYISNFVSSGNPNRGEPVPVDWPAYDPRDPFYLQIGDRLRSEPCTDGKDVEFWVNILPNVAGLAATVSKFRFLPQISDANGNSSLDCVWKHVLGMDRDMTHHVIWVLILLVGVLMIVTIVLLCHVLRRKRPEPLT